LLCCLFKLIDMIILLCICIERCPGIPFQCLSEYCSKDKRYDFSSSECWLSNFGTGTASMLALLILYPLILICYLFLRKIFFFQKTITCIHSSTQKINLAALLEFLENPKNVGRNYTACVEVFVYFILLLNMHWNVVE
jgi:hypothetical protein